MSKDILRGLTIKESQAHLDIFNQQEKEDQISRIDEKIEQKVPGYSSRSSRMKNKVNLILSELYEKLKLENFIDDITLRGLSDEEKEIVIDEALTSMRQFIEDVGFHLAAKTIGKAVPVLGNGLATASDSYIKLIEQYKQKISEGKTQIILNKILENTESIMKSLPISGKVSPPVEPVSPPQATTGVGGGRKNKTKKRKRNKTKKLKTKKLITKKKRKRSMRTSNRKRNTLIGGAVWKN